GTTVTITGTGFTPATTVKFGEVEVFAANVEFKSETKIKAIAPAGAGKVDITVTTEAETSATNAKDQFAYIPSVTKLVPAEGPAAGGTSATITATGCQAEHTTVKFGEVEVKAANVEFKSTTEITVTAPPGAGKPNVTVTTEGGSSTPSSGDEFAYVPSV